MPDLSNIQGNTLRGYASYTEAHFLLLAIRSADAGRALIQSLVEAEAVTPAQWCKRPVTTLNFAISFEGLRALGLSGECLGSFPAEFQEGMKHRARELGDVAGSCPDRWDEPWRTQRVHILLMIYASTRPELDQQCRRIRDLLPAGVEELQPSQPAGRLHIDGAVTRREHFGFLDGISNPDIEGVPADEGPGRAQDIGNPDGKGRFRKIPVGEFILGYPGEGGELAPMPLPHLLAQDGSYLVFRKLQQDVIGFRRYLQNQAHAFARTLRNGMPYGVKVEDFLAAKMMGRWQDGSPLTQYPHSQGGSTDNNFAYAGDPAGARCPLGAHIRRANPRDALGFGGRTMSRHRLIRRGIAYGNYLPPDRPDEEDGKRGIIFIAFNSGFDQFEFVQRNWINLGDDFEQGNDTDSIAGSHDGGRMTIPGDEATGRRPFICFDIPRFVDTRGGDYFFVPSLAGLRLLASNRIEVT
jgi:Dyp-type peroxidase family